MASFLKSWNPVVSFPEYHGQYDVGTVDVEVPAADLPAPSAVPDGAAPTVSFRIFYPCVKPSSTVEARPVRWIPQPQRPTMRAFANFLAPGSKIAQYLSYLPQQLLWVNLPAYRNAKLLDPPTSNGRWPVTVFSHGLAGSRNAYSYVCGDLASNGMIVLALDHRDGSSPIQYVRQTNTTDAYIVNDIKISHEPSPAVYEGRDKQLRIRLWEISMAYEALMKIDGGQRLENLDINASTKRKERVEVLDQFDGILDIHRAGKVSFAGHSFGACTTVQLVKEIFYHKERPATAGKPLIVPNSDAAIAHQIMPESPIMLLDMWGLPFKSHDQAFLWDKPLPTYAVGGPAGTNVVSILSESFFQWQDNLSINKHIIAKPSQSRRPSTAPRLSREPGHLLPTWAKLAREESPSRDSGYASAARSLTRQRSKASGISSSKSAQRSPISSQPLANPTSAPPRTQGPHLCFVKQSQHFNQSDFGLLFPWIAKRFTKAEEPERIMELNFRAMGQMLRENGVEVAGEDDKEILQKDGEIRRWTHVPVEEEAQANSPEGIKALTRKLSGVSSKSMSSPRDGLTMGMTMEGQGGQLPSLELPDPMQK